MHAPLETRFFMMAKFFCFFQHFIGDDNENASESDFKKAFELLSYLPDVVDDDDVSHSFRMYYMMTSAFPN